MSLDNKTLTTLKIHMVKSTVIMCSILIPNLVEAFWGCFGFFWFFGFVWVFLVRLTEEYHISNLTLM